MRTSDKQSTTPREDIRSEPIRNPRTSEEAYSGTKAGRIAEESPEGLPADPNLGPSGIVKMMIGALAIVLLASGLTWATAGPNAALGVLIVGIMLAIVVNPVIYASALRAKERGKVEDSN